jgi:putative aldouronate transport system substrate-binding protein
LLVVSLLVMTLAGCTAAESTVVPTPKPSDVTAATAEPETTAKAEPETTAKAESEKAPDTKPGEVNWFHKFDPPVTISANIVVSPDMKLMDGDDVLNNPYSRWAEETVGIQFESAWQASDNTADIQKINMAMVSNTLPDIITLKAGDTSQKLVEAGQLLPLNDLIQEYGSPLTKYVIDKFQKMTGDKYLAYFMKGDQYYALPNMADIWAVTSNNLWLRKDLLDEMKMDIPTTLSEFEALLAAYKNTHPDGVPFTYNPDPVIAAMNGAPRRWVDDGNGGLAYGSIMPIQKEILGKMNSWYELGYLDKEFFTKSNDFLKNMEGFLQGKGLSSYGMWWNIYWPFPDLWKANETANIVALSPLKGEDGKQRLIMDVKSAFSIGKAINVKCEHPEALVYLLNEQIDSIYRGNDELRKLMETEYEYTFKYPFEQKQLPSNPDAEPKDQKYKYSMQGPEFFNDFTGNPVHIYLGFHYAQGPDDLINQYRRIMSAMDNNKMEGLSNHDKSVYNDMLNGGGERAVQTHFSNIKNYDVYKDSVELIVDKYTGAPTATMVDKGAYLDKLEEETFTKIIIGEVPLDSFDTFVEQWKSAGGSEITAEVNAWYKTNQ